MLELELMLVRGLCGAVVRLCGVRDSDPNQLTQRNGLYKPPPAHVSWLSRYLTAKLV